MKRKPDNEILNEGLIDQALVAEEEEIKSRKFKYGTLATVFTVIFIIAIILVNVLLGYMTERFVWEFDMTKEQLFDISEDTKEVIDDMTREVTITVLADETVFRDAEQMLSNVYEILQRYEALGGGKIKVRYVNPNMNPKIFEQYNTLGDLGNNYLIVESDLRMKSMSPNSLYNIKVDEESNISYFVGIRAEQQLTSALLFVTQESVNTACWLRGHGEDYSKTQLDSILNKMNYDTQVIILAQDEIPEECTLLIINAPETDYGPDEIEKLDAFFKRGGDAIVALSPETSVALTNLNSFFEEWGVRYRSEFVLDNYQSISNMPFYVVPTITNIKNVTDRLNTKNYYALVPGCMPIELTSTETSNHNLAVLMSSSRRSYSKDLNEITLGYDYDEANDPSGPFNMCVISEYLATDKNMNYTRGDILFCSAGMISDTVLQASNYLNGQFVEHVLDYISEYSDGVVIPDKNFESTMLNLLSWQSRLVLYIVVIALPLLILVAGILIWSKRRHL
jgi:predicted small integral membrane protein